MYLTEDEQRLGAWGKELLSGIKESDAANEVLRLREVINYADWKYYVQDNPVFADKEYDDLFRSLKELETTFPELVTADSPTQRIAKGLSEKFPTVSHLVPMLSLDNSYNPDDLKSWDKKCRELTGEENITYTVEPKYDGAGISLVYENDLLTRGATRGDGVQGEEITVNVRQIRSIPLSAKLSNENVGQMEIRGEVLIHKEIFRKYNAIRAEEGLPALANPRNAASGTLRMLDPAEVAKRGLSAILYHVSYHHNAGSGQDSPVFASHYATLEWLASLGFSTPLRHSKKCKNIDEVIDFCLEYEEIRDSLPFEIDGMVVKVNRLDLQDRLGMTSHHPRWAIAYKFKARQATAKLLNVEFQVGRTGTITPIAKIEPVAIGGVTVSSVSLFNEDVIRGKELLIGDQVLVERAGDVIPYIVKPIKELRTGAEQTITFPSNCPTCAEPLFKIADEVAWRCVNASCPAQIVEHLIHFASKNAMDIRNLGASNVKRFYDLGLVTSISEIYTLDFDRLKPLEKFGRKSIENLRQAIEVSKSQPLHRLIFGLGIRYVGETTAKTLAHAVDHVRDLCGWTEEQLCTLQDIGPKVASSVFRFFQTPENIQLLEELERLGVNVLGKKEEPPKGSVLSGQTFLFTGTLTHFTRTVAEELVEKNGGQVLKSVTSKLNYLVVGTDAGSKLEKAKRLGSVRIIDEQAFLALIGDAEPK